MKFENGNRSLSEWEDNVLFDADDPDFLNMNVIHRANVLRPLSSLMIPSTMSLAKVHGPHLNDICTPLGRSNISISSSVSDLETLEVSMENVLSIEELRAQMGSCFTCGVSWNDDHVSLDCSECGGYSIERPCPLCDGQCGVLWKRDFTMSHASGKARWQGVCLNYPEATRSHPPTSNTIATPTCQMLAQELCARLEQLSTSAQT